MKSVLLIILFSSVVSFASSDLISSSHKVIPGSPVSELIDQVYNEILTSPKNYQIVCQLFQSYADLHYSLGISVELAKQILINCPSRASLEVSKIIRKSYYIVPYDDQSIESWTDQGNRTFLFLGDSTTYNDLKIRLLHELAIQYDAKMNLLFTRYLELEKPSIEISGEHRKILNEAFNSSHWYPVARSFSAMRAFEFEKLWLSDSLQPMTHEDCESKFINLFNNLKSFSDQFKLQEPSPSQMATIISDYVSELKKPRTQEQEKVLIEFLMSENLKVESRNYGQLSFCQYMSLPILSSDRKMNFMSHGPRPRVTGGSGGQSSYSNSFQLDKSERTIELQNKIREMKSEKTDIQLMDPSLLPKRMIPIEQPSNYLGR